MHATTTLPVAPCRLSSYELISWFGQKKKKQEKEEMFLQLQKIPTNELYCSRIISKRQPILLIKITHYTYSLAICFI